MKDSTEMVDHPPHYQTAAGIEAIDVIESYGFAASWHIGDAMKYLLRAGKKGDLVTDLRKARWYLNRWLNRDIRASDYSDLDKAAYEDLMRGKLKPDAIVVAFELSGHREKAVRELLQVGDISKVIEHIDAAIAEASAPPNNH